MAVGEHEGFLRKIVGERVIPGGEAAQRRAHSRLVAPHELRERMPIIVDDDACNERCIGDRR